MTLPRNPETLRAWRARSQPLGRSQGLTRTGFLQVVSGDGAPVITFPARKAQRVRDTIPRDVRRIVAKRDMGLCVYTGRPFEHIHHRRLKGMGGTDDEHANCPCNLICLTMGAHEFAHRNRFAALAEGLIVPRSTRLPGLLPVLVHGYEDGSGVRVWPSCDGRWLDYEPGGGGAA